MTRLIPALLAATTIAASIAPAVAASRPDTRNMTCNEVRQLIRERGSIVLSTGRHTYAKYVSGQAYCESGLYANYSPVPTKDRKSCDAGYECTASEPFGFDRRR